MVRIWKGKLTCQWSKVLSGTIFLCTSVFLQGLLRNSLRWPIYISNSVDKTNYQIILSADLAPSFFRNLPPLFLMVLRVNRSEYYFHWPSLFFFSFFFLSFQNIIYKTTTSNSIPHLNFCKNFLLYQNKPGISVFLRFPTKTQINRLVKRYETVRFNWYRQCSIPCYAILENCLKNFQSSCSTAQKVSL